MKLKFLLASLLVVVSVNAFAKNIVLMKMTSDHNDERVRLGVGVDGDGMIKSFFYTVFNGNGSVKSRNVFSGSKLNKIYTSGFTLKKKKGYRIIVLKSRNFDQKLGGRLNISYMTNALRKTRGSISLSLKSNPWRLEKNGKKVKKAKVYKNTVFGQVVGVKRISVF